MSPTAVGSYELRLLHTFSRRVSPAEAVGLAASKSTGTILQSIAGLALHGAG